MANGNNKNNNQVVSFEDLWNNGQSDTDQIVSFDELGSDSQEDSSQVISFGDLGPEESKLDSTQVSGNSIQPEEDSGFLTFNKSGLSGLAEQGAEGINSFARSAISGLGQVIESLGTGADQLRDRVLGDVGTIRVGDKTREGYDQSILTNLGQNIEGLAQDLFPDDPEVQNNFVNSTFPQALGSTLTFVAAGAAGGAPATAIAGGLQLGQTAFEEAKEKGKDDDTAMKAFLANVPLGGLEAIPISRFLSRVNKVSGGGLTKAISDGIKGGVDEALQEMGQQVGSNFVAGEFYDNTREILQGVGEGGASGFAVGFFLNGMGVSLKQMRSQELSEIQKQDLNRAEGLIESKKQQIQGGVQEQSFDSPFFEGQSESVDISNLNEDTEGFTEAPKKPSKVIPENNPNSQEEFVDNVDAAGASSDMGINIRMSGLAAFNQKNLNLGEDVEFKSVSDEVSKRKREAFGIQKPSLISRIKDKAKSVKNSFFRSYQNLDEIQDAQGIDVLRQYEAASEYSEMYAYNAIKNTVSDLDSKSYEVFIDNIMLPDIIKDVEAGLYKDKELPFGYESKEQVQQDLESARQKAEENPEIQKAIQKRQSFVDDLKKRLVEYDLLDEKILEDDRYFHRQVTKYYNNKEYVSSGLSSADVRLKQKGFQKKRTGGGDFNTAYHEAEFEWVSQAIKQISTVETLNRLNGIYNIAPQLQEEASLLKERGEDVNWRDLIPEDHTIWKPEKGNYFYQALSIEDRIVHEVLKGERDLSEGDLKEVLAVSSSKDRWVIPDRVAKTLDKFNEPPDNGPISKIARSLNTSWKQWVLINPIRVLKYNLNNTSGDLDISLAYDPKIASGYLKDAARDLYRNLKNKADLSTEKEIEELVRLGVINSGLTVQEIPDISKEGVFKSLTNPNPNLLQKYWRNAKDYTNLRENVLRLAAYRRFKERIESGEENIYGASKPEQIDQITDPSEKAAKLARELVGDYGNISPAGQWLRSNMIPFYSWMEINAPRYVRMLKNLPREGRDIDIRKVGAKQAAKGFAKLTGKATSLAIKANIMYGLVNLWNHTFFPDEEEEFIQNRGQLHLILGRNDDGTIRSIRFEGALSDALEWLNLHDLPSDIEKLGEGDKDAGDMVQEAAKGFANRIINSSVPIPKTIAESLFGVSAYPDAFNARTIRDPGEHLSRLVSADWLYNYVTNKPTPPQGPLQRLVFYRTNPGEAAYYHTKRMVIDHLKEQGKEFPRIQPTERSNALYYHKQAIKYGEQEKAKFWLKQYLELGGKLSGMKQSINRSEPLSNLSGNEKTLFMLGLSEDEKEIVARGKQWYRSTYED